MKQQQPLKLIKIKNLISFGKQSMTSSHNSDIPVRSQDSYSIDLCEQVGNLGVQITSVSQKQIMDSQDNAILNNCMPPQNTNTRRKETTQNKPIINNNSLKQQSYFQNSHKGSAMTKNKAAEQFSKCNPRVSESIIIQNYQRPCDRKLAIDSFVCSVKLKIKSQPHKNANTFDSICMQVQKLRSQNQFYHKQIEILKREIDTLKTLDQEKQKYHKEQLRLQKMDFQRRISKIMLELNSNLKQFSQNHSKSWKSQNSMQGSLLQPTVRSRSNTGIRDKELMRCTYINLKDSIGNNSDKFERLGPFTSRQSRSKDSMNENDVHYNLRIIKQNQRKYSTNSSFERVNEKIRKFESSIKKLKLK